MRHFTFSMLAVAAVAISGGCQSVFPASELKVSDAADSATVSADSGPAQCEIKHWHPDSDGDGYGSSDPKLMVDACTAPTTPTIQYIADNTDCNDAAKSVHPKATEICNKVDDDCDGQTDNSATMDWWVDGDGDGYGNAKLKHTGACTGVESWLVANGDDCDDNNPKINPGMKETCDTPGIDDNCNGQTDEGQLSTFHADVDGDGHGSSDPKKEILACAPSKKAVVSNDDCDDTDVKNFPGNPEVCDGQDNNCNGQTDEGKLLTFFKDDDGDGHGHLTKTVEACIVPAGATTTSDDCNDDPKTGGSIHPGAKEECNLIDDNCDGQIDEGVQTVYHMDLDKDGFGDPKSEITLACSPPKGMAFASGDAFADCDDADPNVHPGAKEICDGKVNDCSAGALNEPNSLCDDGSKFTQDICGGASGCTHNDELLILDCTLSPKFKKTDGWECSVAYMYEYGPQKYSPMVTGVDSASLTMAKVCAELKAGAILHVNSYAFVDFDPAANWMGGEFTKLIDSFTNAAAAVVPGNQTLGSELDFNYSIVEIKACQ